MILEGVVLKRVWRLERGEITLHYGKTGWVTRNGKTIHLKDDDCPVSSRIMKGRVVAYEVDIEKALQSGYRICKTCWKEYQEDKLEKEILLWILFWPILLPIWLYKKLKGE